MIVDHFLTISQPTIGEFKDKGSKFIGFAYRLDHEDELAPLLQNLRSIHIKACHFCYAYKIGVDGLRFRANDDGEPSGSAGKPILGQINSLGLTNVVVIVVRYFGGTKLGVPGLIHAYKEATKLAFDEANIIEEIIKAKYEAMFEYEKMGEILNAFKACNIELSSKVFEASCKVTFEIRKTEEEQTIHRLKAKLLQKSMEEVTSETKIDWCAIECCLTV